MKNKKTFIIIALIIIVVLVSYCAFKIEPDQPATSIEYKNEQYGFSFTLPISWKEYSIVDSTWQGYAPGESGNVVSEKGPLISIRHPEWAKEKPRQDIPIMIFTLSQWNRLLRGEIYVSAAPVNPKRLGFNENYVFALPARYNFAFPEGFEEVERILQENPLRAISKKSLSGEGQILLCGGIPNGSTENISSTTRLFINLPKRLYPKKENSLKFATIAGDANANWISDAGPYGEAFEATKDCWSYYYEFDGVGAVDLSVTNHALGAPDYSSHFIVNAARQ
jgi:hypothetical protein